MSKHANHIISLLAAALLAAGCNHASLYGDSALTCPDYVDVTIPYNIAPLNFRYTNAAKAKTSFNAGDVTVKKKGVEIKWKQNRWKSLTSAAAGGSISVNSSLRMLDGSLKDTTWTIYVSKDKIDSYLTYRLIEPGYEVWHEVEIRERNIENFDERTISSHKNTGNACMNCHIHAGSRGEISMFYLRGKNGGAIFNDGSKLRKLNLKTEGMKSSTVYGEISPDGKWGIFSTNTIIPALHATGNRRLEVYDKASDLVLADFDNNRMVINPGLARSDKFETFPVWSADGSQVFYCGADSTSFPGGLEELRYSLIRASFDRETGKLGAQTDTIWNARKMGASVCHPKASPDGRWILYTVADYGTFPIWHREADLQLMDLQNGQIHELPAANSEVSDTYHSWSSESKWIVFASKRGDGQYGKPFFCHINEDGSSSKPFVLPQENPAHYAVTLKSYNIPDLAAEAVPFDMFDTGRMWYEADSEAFTEFIVSE